MNKDISELKAELKKLVYLIIRELFNDFAIFNKYPELKFSSEGIKIYGNEYNRYYYQELLDEIKTDFVLGLCYLYSISYVDLVNKCMQTKTIYADGPEIDSMQDRARNRPDRRIRLKVKSLKVKAK